MQILLVKTSSLGDVVHNLPVVDDLRAALPGVQIDWLVEQAFVEVPRLHPGVRTVISCALRRWRRAPFSAATRAEWAAMRSQLRAERYDLIVDTQGLLKSALLACLAHGPRAGFDRDSARESLASRLYQRRFPVARAMHALERNRQLVALAAGYPLTRTPGYGLDVATGVASAGPARTPLPPVWDTAAPFAVLLHSTARDEKLWSESLWIALARDLYSRLGIRSVLPWGSEVERERSERLAQAIPGAQVPARTGLTTLAHGLACARVVIGVDTGLLHLASAVGARCIGIYVASDPARNGLYPDSVGLNLGGVGMLPGVDDVLAAVLQVTAWLPE